MHTTKLPGIDMEVAKQLVSNQLCIYIHNTEKTMGTGFALDWHVDGKKFSQGRAFDFTEPQCCKDYNLASMIVNYQLD
ncbi:hypothetical protein BDR04DRAFT_1095259 [Suillus decipiens]|nr:hypothetical protein BDR04DRAFT_1095259 [Suillus decipiens]